MDYLSPEMIVKDQYGKEVDVWSIGILAYELCHGSAPFASNDNRITKNKISKMNYFMPEAFSNDLKTFVSSILQKDGSKRPSVVQLLQHPWIVNGVQEFRKLKKQESNSLGYFK